MMQVSHRSRRGEVGSETWSLFRTSAKDHAGFGPMIEREDPATGTFFRAEQFENANM